VYLLAAESVSGFVREATVSRAGWVSRLIICNALWITTLIAYVSQFLPAPLLAKQQTHTLSVGD